MSGRKSSPPEKNKELVEADPARSIMFTAQDALLTTKYEILEENHECLKKDYASLEVRLKDLREMNALMKSHLQNQTMEPEARKQRLLKDLETEKDEKMEIIEEIKRVEDAMRIKDEEVLIKEEEAETRIKRMEDMYNELSETFGAVERRCSYVKSLFDAENLIGQGENNVADDNEEEYRSLNNTVTDAIVISDDSDVEYDNPPRESSNVSPQMSVGVKQDEQSCNGATSSQVNHPLPSSSSSSSSSSSDEFILVPLPAKRSG